MTWRSSSTTQININQTPDLYLGENPKRVAVHIQNRSFGSIYFRFGSRPSQVIGSESYDSIEIPVNMTYIVDQNCPTESLFLMADANNSICVLMEVSEDI